MMPEEEKDRVIAAVKADNGFMKEFVEDFLNDVPQDVQALEEAILQKNHTEMERLAHSLKSVVGFFNATIAYEMAKELEALGREGNLKESSKKFEALKDALDSLKDLLISTL